METLAPEECASTLRKRRIMLGGLFAFGQRIGVAERNPAHAVRNPQAAVVETVGILTPAESRDYLLAVATLSPALLGLEAICLFGELRRAEAERLGWSAVHLKRGFIEIGAAIAKTRSRRLVDIRRLTRMGTERPVTGDVHVER